MVYFNMMVGVECMIGIHMAVNTTMDIGTVVCGIAAVNVIFGIAMEEFLLRWPATVFTAGGGGSIYVFLR